MVNHMRKKATLLYRSTYIYPDRAIREMVLLQLPARPTDRAHGLKYGLYYGQADGTCVVRYDNEAGKGDHRHYGDLEERYRFENVETLVNDFLSDIAHARGEVSL